MHWMWFVELSCSNLRLDAIFRSRLVLFRPILEIAQRVRPLNPLQAFPLWYVWRFQLIFPLVRLNHCNLGRCDRRSNGPLTGWFLEKWSGAACGSAKNLNLRLEGSLKCKRGRILRCFQNWSWSVAYSWWLLIYPLSFHYWSCNDQRPLQKSDARKLHPTPAYLFPSGLKSFSRNLVYALKTHCWWQVAYSILLEWVRRLYRQSMADDDAKVHRRWIRLPIHRICCCMVLPWVIIGTCIGAFRPLSNFSSF